MSVTLKNSWSKPSQAGNAEFWVCSEEHHQNQSLSRIQKGPGLEAPGICEVEAKVELKIGGLLGSWWAASPPESVKKPASPTAMAGEQLAKPVWWWGILRCEGTHTHTHTLFGSQNVGSHAYILPSKRLKELSLEELIGQKEKMFRS